MYATYLWPSRKVNDWLRPQLFGKTYIVNPPRWLSMASRLAGGIMSKKSLEKVVIHKAKVNESQPRGAESNLFVRIYIYIHCNLNYILYIIFCCVSDEFEW